MSLTELAIKHAKPKERPYTLTDGGGLGVEISPTGGKLWRWRYRYNGKAQTLALGISRDWCPFSTKEHQNATSGFFMAGW